MTGHTPYPWTVDEYGDVIANGEDIARIASSYNHAEADARLIAAAPDLLEALVALLYDTDMGGGMTPDAIHLAEAAIAKATDGNKQA